MIPISEILINGKMKLVKNEKTNNQLAVVIDCGDQIGYHYPTFEDETSILIVASEKNIDTRSPFLQQVKNKLQKNQS